MAKRSRLQKVVDKGYESGIWQSTIVHCLLFIILALTFETVLDRQSPISITFSYTSNNESFDHTPALSIDFAESIDSLEDNTAVDLTNLLPDLNLEIDIENIEKDQEKCVESLDISNLNDPSQLMAKVDLPEPESNKPKFESKVGKKTTKVNNAPNASSSTSGMDLFKTMLEGGAQMGNNIPKHMLVGHPKNSNDLNGSGSGTPSIESVLSQYGAQSGDIQISIMWHTVDDIDLHVVYQNRGGGEEIFWKNRRGRSGGMLDIDMNGRGPMSNLAVENIFWPTGRSPSGMYRVGVKFFRPWTNNTTLPVQVRIQTLKGVWYHNAVVTYKRGIVWVTEFSN